MDLGQLIEPYAERDDKGNPARTIEAQIKWLLKKGIPRDHIDKAILSVYSEIEKGKTYASGHDLDHALLDAAKGSHHAEISDSVRKLEDFFNGLKTPAASRWKHLKAVFTGKVT